MRICQSNDLFSGAACVFRYGFLPSALQVFFDGHQKVFMDITLIRVNTRYRFMLHLLSHHDLQSPCQLMSLHRADMMASDFQR